MRCDASLQGTEASQVHRKVPDVLYTRNRRERLALLPAQPGYRRALLRVPLDDLGVGHRVAPAAALAVAQDLENLV